MKYMMRMLVLAGIMGMATTVLAQETIKTTLASIWEDTRIQLSEIRLYK